MPHLVGHTLRKFAVGEPAGAHVFDGGLVARVLRRKRVRLRLRCFGPQDDLRFAPLNLSNSDPLDSHLAGASNTPPRE